MTTILPIDSNSNPIPALRLKAGGGQSVNAVTSASTVTANAFAPETRIVSVYATVPVYLNFGESGVTADTADHYFPAGIYYDFCIGGGPMDHTPYLAVLAAAEDGVVYLSEKY